MSEIVTVLIWIGAFFTIGKLVIQRRQSGNGERMQRLFEEMEKLRETYEYK